MDNRPATAPGPHFAGAFRGPGPVRRCRAELVLVLGFLSLFFCGPLGILAWILANSELRQMRGGLVSCDRVRSIKVGRVLGIVGTVLFVVSVGVLVKMLPGLLPETAEIMSPEPLRPDQMVFAGEWYGEKGTLIRIYPDGRADLRTTATSLTGGRVRIDETTLAIGAMGVYTKWRVERKPFLEDGVWKMRLDGETFSRKAEGLLVVRAVLSYG